MPDVAEQPAKPLRTWLPMVLLSAGILLALGLVWFATILVGPARRTSANLPPTSSNMGIDRDSVVQYLALVKDGRHDYHELARLGSALFVRGRAVYDHAEVLKDFPTFDQEGTVVYTLWQVSGQSEWASITVGAQGAGARPQEEVLVAVGRVVLAEGAA